MKRRIALLVGAVLTMTLVPASPAQAWERMPCVDGASNPEGGTGTWRGHGNGSPVEIWYTNRDLTTGNDEMIRHIHDTNVKTWNGKIGSHATMLSVKIEGDSYLPGTAKSDYDFDSVHAGWDKPSGWFTSLCDSRRHLGRRAGRRAPAVSSAAITRP